MCTHPRIAVNGHPTRAPNAVANIATWKGKERKGKERKGRKGKEEGREGEGKREGGREREGEHHKPIIHLPAGPHHTTLPWQPWYSTWRMSWADKQWRR